LSVIGARESGCRLVLSKMPDKTALKLHREC
jgi:hypothetical protein